jgi:hypothetical protein
MATTGATFELWLRLVWSLVRRSSMSNLIRSRKARVSAILATAAVSMGIMAGPASAQVDQDGLVNVNISDNNIVVPVQVAANVCIGEVNAVILANLENSLNNGAEVNCEVGADQQVEVTQNQEGQQRGANRPSA